MTRHRGVPLPGAGLPDKRRSRVIRFDDVSKSYGARAALRNLSLRVRPGEVYALIGPNGSGKTTALRCLAGLLRPDSGTILVDAHDVQDARRMARRRLGFLSSSPGLYERLTPRELIRYFGELHGLEGPQLEQHIEELVLRFGIRDFADRYCGRLSSGQRQRVAIARAVVHDPPALVFDEPTTGLDLVAAESIYAFLWEERDRGRAILFSSHEMDSVRLIADRIGVLSRGRLVGEGSLHEILQETGQPNLPRAFLHLVARYTERVEGAA